MTARAEALVGKAVMALVLQEPFYGHVLGGMNRAFTDETPTAAVTLRHGRPTLLVNADFFCGLGRADERTAVVKHEVLHVVLGHLVRARRQGWDAHIANLAADLVVNQLIGRWPLPAGAVTLATYAHLGLPRDGTLEQYYHLLLPHRDALPEVSSDHHLWGASDADEAILADIEIGRLIAHAKDRSPESFSRLPGAVRGVLDALLEARTPQLDWRKVLRIFSESSRKTRLATTVRRPSKRYGTLPGTRVRRKQVVVVAVDTSGSVSRDTLTSFFAEVHGVWRQGATVVVLECDAQVQAEWTYGGTPPAAVRGRGGTSFDPVFRWVADQRARPDALVYLTDGCAPTPTVAIHVPVLWVVWGGAPTDHLRPGRVVRLR